MFFQKTGTRLFSPWWFGLYGIEEINNQRLGKAVIPLDQLLHQAKERLREFALHTTSSIVPVGRPPTCWHPPERRTTVQIELRWSIVWVREVCWIGCDSSKPRGPSYGLSHRKNHAPFYSHWGRRLEAMAARRALSLALETGFDRVVLEGDSQVLVTALQNNSYT